MGKWKTADLSKFRTLIDGFGVEVRNISIPVKVFCADGRVLCLALSHRGGMFEYLVDDGAGYVRCGCGRAFKGEVDPHVH